MPPHGGGTGGARSKREKDAGAEFDRRGQFRPRYGGSSEPVPMNLADLLPDAPDSVPGGGALPHLRLPSRLFWCLDAWTSFSSRASRLDECVLGRGFFCRPAGDGGLAPRWGSGAKRGKRGRDSASNSQIRCAPFNPSGRLLHGKSGFSFGPCMARQGKPRSGEKALWRVFFLTAPKRKWGVHWTSYPHV